MNEEKTVTLHFFANNELLQISKEEPVTLTAGDGFIFDVVNHPLQCRIEKNEKNILFRFYSRNAFGTDGNTPACTIHFSPDGKRIRDKRKSPNADLARLFLRAASYLKRFIHEQELEQTFTDLHTETEGIIVRLDEENNLHLTRTSGKQRPDLAFTALFGNIEMGRAYSDEVEEEPDTDSFSTDDNDA